MVRRLSLTLVLLLFVGSACENTTNLVSKRPVDAGNTATDADGPAEDAAQADASTQDAAPPFAIVDGGLVYCGSSPCACANGIDDDNDGLIDGLDGECTGPYDQDEASFATGEIKEGNPRCVDCFFDGNPGAGDDGCRIAANCSQVGSPAGAPGSCNTCEANAECVNRCLPRTPNGCDCFGCCEITTSSGTVHIQLVDTCSLRDLMDTRKCPRCELNPSCKNECGRCELCPGKTIADLPADCHQAGGPGYTCEQGSVCGDIAPCAPAEYCTQGCCTPPLL